MNFWWKIEDDEKQFCTLYQCINNSGVFEEIGRNVVIGVGNAVIYETNNTRSTSIFWKCEGRTPPGFGRFTDVARAWQHFSFLTDPSEHLNGVWRFSSANFKINSGFRISRNRYSLNVNFYWSTKFRIRKKFDDVDWMKEGF